MKLFAISVTYINYEPLQQLKFKAKNQSNDMNWKRFQLNEPPYSFLLCLTVIIFNNPRHENVKSNYKLTKLVSNIMRQPSKVVQYLAISVICHNGPYSCISSNVNGFLGSLWSSSQKLLNLYITEFLRTGKSLDEFKNCGMSHPKQTLDLTMPRFHRIGCPVVRMNHPVVLAL